MAQSLQAFMYYDGCEQQTVATQDQNCGDVLQLPDGRVGIVKGLAPKSAGDPLALQNKGVFGFGKASGVSILRGGRVYWQRDNLCASYSPGAAGFYLGRAVGDAAASDAYVYVDINVIALYRLALEAGVMGGDLWSSTVVKTSGSPSLARQTVGGGYVAALDTTAEAQKVDAISVDSVRCIDGLIFEARLAINNHGNNAALNIAFGLANGTNATAYSNITERAMFVVPGNAYELNAQTVDTVNAGALTDTTLALAQNTYYDFWIDARDLANVKFYVDGAQVLASTNFRVDNAVGPLYPLFWMGKTNNATPGQASIDFLRMRTSN